MYLFLRIVLEVTQMSLNPWVSQKSHMAILISLMFENINIINIIIFNKGFHLTQAGPFQVSWPQMFAITASFWCLELQSSTKVSQ